MKDLQKYESFQSRTFLLAITKHNSKNLEPNKNKYLLSLKTLNVTTKQFSEVVATNSCLTSKYGKNN
jgi:hypothetical protein